MYYPLLIIHSIVRWLLLAGMVYAIYRSLRGYCQKRNFTSLDNSIRHWTATIAHIQLIVGVFLYLKSGVVVSLYKGRTGNGLTQPLFFGLIHITTMLGSIILITIGAMKAKRASDDVNKFKQMLLWFSIALALILIAIPWPFSPLAQRPIIRLY